MSQLVGIAGATAESRRAYTAAAMPRLPLLATQATKAWTHGDVNVSFATANGAPLSTDAGGAFVLGRWSENADGANRSEAKRVLTACEMDGGRSVADVAVYGAAGCISPAGDVWLGCDTLGLFPLYYHATPDRLLFSTSPALIEAHPDFTPAFNVRGLVGNLLTMHMVGGETLRTGVRRLSPGHALYFRRGDGASEIAVGVLEPADAHFGESFDQHLDRFDAALDRVARLDSANGSTALLLSGGLDSRLLAGLLRRTLGTPVAGITCGQPQDLEMRIASRVARHLRWPQHAVDVDASRFLDVADRHLTHFQLGHGFNDMAFWYAAEAAANGAGAKRVFTGVMGDTVMGGCHIPWGFDPKSQTYSFETIFRKINRYGFTPAQVRALVRPDVLGDSLDAALANLRDQYDRCAGLPFQKVWLFDLLNRNRFHIAGLAWEVGAGAWPVLAFATREMLRAAGNMPADTLMQRRTQREWLIRHAPDLAALPLDRNNRTDLSPVKYASRWQRLWDQKVMGKYRRALRKLHDRRGVETRYYYRVYDINSPTWTAVRRAAEPHRKLAEQIFQPEVLRELLPPPETPIQLDDGIVDASRLKTLLGFMLWAGKNL
jgi:asparagine synthase (glutamine-hydrolysing)